MANLLLTDYCNRACPYCFAKEKLSRPDTVVQHQLSFEKLVVVLDFLERSGVKRFSILGGEPTLHPQFAYFLRYVLGREFRINVFTNGIISPKVLKEIAGVIGDFRADSSKLFFVVNLNERQLRSPKEDRSQRRAFAVLKENASLSFNIFRPDHDLSFLLTTIAEYGLDRRLRLGLAQPIIGRQNQGLPVEYYSTVAEQVVALAVESDRQDVRVDMDCSFLMCLFSDAHLGALYRAGTHLNFSCGPAIDIGPDLRVWFCFPLSATKSVLLTEFADFTKMVDHLTEMFRPELENKGLYEQCSSCKFLRRRQCAGGCISHYLERDIAQIG